MRQLVTERQSDAKTSPFARCHGPSDRRSGRFEQRPSAATVIDYFCEKLAN